jgi:serine/threonine-protein kinase RsbW
MKGSSNSLRLKSNASELNKVEKLIEALADKYYLNDSYFANMMVALTEAFNNALVHGNNNDSSKEILIDFRFTGQEMVFTITDQGNGFAFNEFMCNSHHFENKRGLLLIKTVSDKVEFFDMGRQVSIHFNLASVSQNTAQNRMSALNQTDNVMEKQSNEKQNR